MDGSYWLSEIVAEYRSSKRRAERAAAQVSDEQLFAAVGGNPNSIAVQMKHVGGNLRSRWRDFLTTDGEKRDRHRDTEFVVDGETRESIVAAWEAGWRIALDGLEALVPEDLEREITIRGEPHTVVRAVHRSLLHVDYHTGQIVFAARSLVGDRWETLSVAPGRSEEHNAEMRERYGDWWAGT